MKSSVQVSLIGLSLVCGIALGAAGTLLLTSQAKADQHVSAEAAQSNAAPAQRAPFAAGDYFPAQFHQAQRDAKQHDLPAQF